MFFRLLGNANCLLIKQNGYKIINDLKKQYGLNFIKSLDSHGLFVFPTHNEEWAHNKIKLWEANEQFPVAKIDAVCHSLHSKTSADDAMGEGAFENPVYLCRL